MKQLTLCALALVVGMSGTLVAKPPPGPKIGTPAPVLDAAGPAASQPAPATGLHAEVLKAYRDLKTYSAEVEMRITTTEGRWTTTQQGTYKIAFDRASQSLMLDHPMATLVITGGKLHMVSDQFPGVHLESKVPATLTYETIGLIDGQALLFDPLLADVALLLEPQPLDFLCNSRRPRSIAELPPAADDAAKQPRLKVVDDMNHTWILSIDPQTKLVTHAHKQFDPKSLGGEAGDAMSHEFSMRDAKADQPLPAASFAFDPKGTKPAANLQQMAELAAQVEDEKAQAQEQQQGELKGKPAPDFTIEKLAGGDYTLSKDPSAVIVLDFWATWCPPCVAGMPKLQKVYDWAAEKKLPVTIYAVNQDEDKATINRFLKAKNLTLPVLLDKGSAVGNAYRVEGIPTTVVIHRGKVVEYEVGLDPEMETNLKKRIEELLQKDGQPQ